MIDIIKTLNFGNFLAFYAFISLPIIYFVLKSYPPLPTKYNFSSFFLLREIDMSAVTREKCPIWLLIFRLLLITLLIFFFSKPYLNKNPVAKNYESFVVLSDKGWSIGSIWNDYKKIVENIAFEAEKAKKEVYFYDTTMKIEQKPIKFNNAKDILLFLDKNTPSPWQTDRENLRSILLKNDYFKNSKVFFIFSKFDSISFEKQKSILTLLRDNVPNLEIIAPVRNIKIIKSYKVFENNNQIIIERFGNLDEENLEIRISTEQNLALYRKKFLFEKGKNNIIIEENFPLEVSNLFYKIEVIGSNHAGASYFLDDLSKKKNIGIYSEDFNYIEKPLLSPAYYINKALNKEHNIFLNNLEEILKEKPSVIIFPKSKKLDRKNKKALISWLNNGGLLLKFASNRSSYEKDTFFNSHDYQPTIRNIGGDLSWNKILSLKEMNEDNIFKNISLKDDIFLKKQLIFTNFSTKNLKILVALEDETPLISMKKVGRGKVLLFHFTANNDWSNIPMSNIFIEFLSKALLLSQYENKNSMNSLQIDSEINSFGTLEQSESLKTFENIYMLKKTKPSQNNLPGIYYNNEIIAALNLAGNLQSQSFREKIYSKYNMKNYYKSNAFDLSGFILVIVMIMALVDILISSTIKNKLYFLKKLKNIVNTMSLLIILISFTFIYNTYSSEYLKNTFLAYIKSSNEKRNEISKYGLEALKNTLIRRTSISPEGVVGLDVNADTFFYFPFIYWPVDNEIISISENAKNKIKNYLKTGGIILFDIINFDRNKSILESKSYIFVKEFLLSIGIEDLNYIRRDHTLSKSFYLLEKYPGRWDSKVILIDNTDLDLKDGVNSVIIGFNDWVGAWALDDNNYPMFPAVPGGERQREMAFRFGVNIIMYALTGNYKSDQIHSKSILNRMKRQ